MSVTLIVSALIAVVALYFTATRKNFKYKYPPSPKGYNPLKGGHAYLLPKGLEVRLPLGEVMVVGTEGIRMGKGVGGYVSR
jgi:hypothetical protein